MPSTKKPAAAQARAGHRKSSARQSSASTAKKSPINPLKKRRRDLKRLLDKRDTLPADLRVGYERELASIEYQLETALHDKQKSSMIGKYHMVRFFERRKAERVLKKLHRQLADTTLSTVQRQALESNIRDTQVDLDYALFYPLDKVYVSLYAKGKESGAAQRHGNKMWETIREASEKGRAALQTLRDGVVDHSGSAALAKGSKMHAKRKADTAGEDTKRTKHAKVEVEQDEAESDEETGAGFFE